MIRARSGVDPRSLARAAQNEVLALDSEQPVFAIRTMEEVLSRSVAQRRLSMVLMGLFAAIAVVLATVGIYGVMSYSMAQRTHEIGIRVALCAVLLVGAGLFERTLGNLRSIDPQMKTDNMLLLSLAPALNGYQRPAARQLYAQLLERIGGLPGVVSVTTALAGPESARPDPAHRQAGLRALADRRSSPG